jgi:hypothetical protein
MIDGFGKLHKLLKYAIIMLVIALPILGFIVGRYVGLEARIECVAVDTDQGVFLALPTIKNERGFIGPFEDYTDALWAGYDMGCHFVIHETDI